MKSEKQFRDLGIIYQKIGLTQAIKDSKIMVIQVDKENAIQKISGEKSLEG
jgi:hypothetical protein